MRENKRTKKNCVVCIQMTIALCLCIIADKLIDTKREREKDTGEGRERINDSDCREKIFTHSPNSLIDIHFFFFRIICYYIL